MNRLVFPHAFAEETVLWPVFRRVLPDGDALTLQVEREHQAVNELVTALERDGRDHPQRPGRLARLIEVLREDVRDEEDVLFPRLQEALDPQSCGVSAVSGRSPAACRRPGRTRRCPAVRRAMRSPDCR